ncbi:hypothetical protein [Planctomyces sp. SH-PL62]|uniref:hypothetical protein n=1 Tax=Planctomyces sp. SH-PL62 TaxID=1636152 RepID=UPI00078BCCF9|nr:hypothetical protein [Planctomyces sp. SH-PL62]AMV37758.1 hypothetical protein VT85_10000 [Planctomyces sp. SH-PL62]
MPDTPVDEHSPAMDSTEGLARESPPPEVIAAAEPTPPSAVDLHLKLGPLQDRGVARPRSAQVWAWALAGGGLAGLASFMIGESLVGWFVAQPPPPPPAGAGPSGLSEADYTATTRALVGNAALAFGLLGGLLGLLLGAAGGMVRSSLRSAVGAGLIGALLGAAAGVGASAAVVPTYARILNRPDTMDFDLAYAVVALGAIWGAWGPRAGRRSGSGWGA